MSKLSELPDNEFATLYTTIGPTAIAERFGNGNIRNVHAHRAKVEHRLGVTLRSPIFRGTLAMDAADELRPESPEVHLPMKDGVVIVASDGHYWPGQVSTAHRALVKVIDDLKPRAVIFNGDALDGASIGRHPPIGWEHSPTLENELDEVKKRLGELQQAGGRKCRYIWPLGNHDARFNMRLAALTPEFRNVAGTRLTHHFPEWEPCWLVEVGGPTGAMVKHRFKGGVHATHNNTVAAGRTLVTGHLHSLKVTPYTDYNGTRWGVDCGCIAAPRGPQFNYSERNPSNHRAGFAVLTWKGGELLWPELVAVSDEAKGLVQFRGEVIRV
jgi:hypothetical protein